MGTRFEDETVPAEPEGVRTLYMPELEHHATALGYFCIVFSLIEDNLDKWFEALLGCTPQQRRVIVNAAGQLSNRCTLLQGLLYTSPMPENSNWREQAEAYLIKLTSELIPLRNRLVHDAWIAGDPPIQWQEHAKLGKVQAFQPKVLLDSTQHERTLDDVWVAVGWATIVNMHLGGFQDNYLKWRETGRYADIPPLPIRVHTPRSARLRDETEGNEPPPGSSPASPRKTDSKG